MDSSVVVMKNLPKSSSFAVRGAKPVAAAVAAAFGVSAEATLPATVNKRKLSNQGDYRGTFSIGYIIKTSLYGKVIL